MYDHLALAARAERLLVATDFDGTIVDLQDDPDEVWPPERALRLLARLATCPGTLVAVLSGRSLGDLQRRVGQVPGIVLVGSHGAEWSGAAPMRLDDASETLLSSTVRRLEDLARGCPGAWVEVKPASAVFHYRAADPALAPAVVQQVLDGPAATPGLHCRHGKDCVELAVTRSTKGKALALLRAEHGADRVVFLGDDVTDEDGFLVLAFQDVGVKVGAGDTAAEHRVGSPADALAILERILELRSRAQGDSGVQTA